MSDAYLTRVFDIIDRHGYMIQAVSSSPDGDPGFAYTVGRSRVGRPEIISIINLDPQLLGDLLNLAVQADDDDVFDDWSFSSSMAEKHVVVFRAVQPSSALKKALIAKRLFPNFRLLQMFLPDAEKRYPWEPGCSPGFAAQQCLEYVRPVPV